MKRINPCVSLIVMIGVLAASTASAEGIWSRSGQVPIPDGSRDGAALSPDGHGAIVGTEREGLAFDDGAQREPLSLVIVPPLWEVVWAPTSQSFAVNASDGGAVGTWNATLYQLDDQAHLSAFPISDLIREEAPDLARCASPEDLNVAVLGWTSSGRHVAVVAEVPPHSSCKNMGALAGFGIDMKSRKIVEHLSEEDLRARWVALFGPRLQHGSQ